MEQIFDTVVEYQGKFEVERFRIGRTNSDPSYLRLKVEAPTEDSMDQMLEPLVSLGCSPVDTGDAELRTSRRDRCAPEDFYSTTNHSTSSARAAVDRSGEPAHGRDDRRRRMAAHSAASCATSRAGDQVVVGMRGIRVVPESKERDRLAFAFMTNGISSERQVETAVRQTAALIQAALEAGQKIMVVAGPVVVHTGGVGPLAKLIRSGWVQALLSGNALGVHDIEAALLGTSLGVRLTDGRQEEHGHRNHMRAINAIYHAAASRRGGGGRLTTGILYECVKNNVPFVLAGSLRDDGPLPDTITDMNAAQDAYAAAVEGRRPGALPRLDAAFHRHRQHAAELGQNRVRGYQSRGRHQGQRSRHRPGGRRGDRRRPVPRPLADALVKRMSRRMKRQYTDEHARRRSTRSCPKSKPGPISIPATKSKS